MNLADETEKGCVMATMEGRRKDFRFTCRLIYWSPEDYPNGQLLLGEPH